MRNRADAEGTLTDTEIVRSPIAARLPFSPAVGGSINKRTSLAVSNPDNPVVLGIRELTVTHLGMEPTAALT